MGIILWTMSSAKQEFWLKFTCDIQYWEKNFRDVTKTVFPTFLTSFYPLQSSTLVSYREHSSVLLCLYRVIRFVFSQEVYFRSVWLSSIAWYLLCSVLKLKL